MQKSLSSKIKNYVKLHIRDKRWKQVVAVLACVVVFCTVYALIIPAVTMTNNTFCGKQEHVHSDACYETVLVCGQSERLEAESSALSEEQTSADPIPSEEIAAADEAVQTENQTENQTEGTVLPDGQDEVTPAVGAAKRVLHAETTAPHVHTEACYEKRLICQEEEHEHTLQCHSDPDAVETPADWTAGLPALTGDRAKDLIAVAESQLGYTESEANFLVTEDGTVKGYTRYGAWYAGGNGTNFSYADWCACFVSFCLNHAGVSSDEFPYAAGCTDWIALLTERGQYEQKGGYTPKPGDIVFLDTNKDETADHVGIVTEVDESAVKTIEGNRADAVGRGSYEPDGVEIVGYGVLPIVTPRRTASTVEVLPEITVKTDPSTSHGNDTATFYTGESAITTLAISNPESAQIEEDDGTVIRVYMQFNKTAPGEGHPESADGAPSQKEGWYTVKATGSERTYEYKVMRVNGEDANHYTYCFEIQRPLQGDTISIRLPSCYPSPTSAGGTNTIWGVVLTKERKAALDEGREDDKPGIADRPADGSNTQVLTWDTKPNRYTLEKSASQLISLVSKSKNISYVDHLQFSIKGKRSTDTLEGVGKDHVYRMEFEDTMTLPENFYFDEKIAQAIKSQEYRVVFCHTGEISFYLKDQIVDYKKHKNAFIILQMESGSEMSAGVFYGWAKTDGPNTKLYLSEDGKSLTITWYAEAGLVDKEEGETVPTFDAGFSNAKIYYLPNTVLTDTEKLHEGETYQIENKVSRKDSFCWSEDQEMNASCVASIQVGKAQFTLTKSRAESGYFGQQTDYTITAGNQGDLPYEQLAYLRDLLPNRLYMSAENLESLFADETYGKGASVKITNATFCAVERESVTDMNAAPAGSTAARNTSPDDNSQKYEGMSDYHQHDEDATGTINIAWSEDGKNLVLTTDSGQTVSCEATASAIQEAFDRLNFLVTNLTQYEVTWARLDEDNKPLLIYGHTEYSIYLPVTVKDTFMLLECDWRHTYPDETVDIGANTVYAEDLNRDQLKSAQSKAYYPTKREFELSKDVTRNKDEVRAIHDGDVLDYALYVTHFGTGAYDQLPLTDHMSGTQALLAEKEKNQDAEWAANCETVTDNGKEYYLLSKPGEYKGVWLNDRYADSVTVTSADDGLDTIIKWYFTNYSGERTDEITYRAMVCPSKLGSTSEIFYIENESWLNDHQTHRLYAPIGRISGTIFVFNKKIVSKEDVVAPADQKEAGVDECTVKEGQTVYYRFTIYPTSKDAELTLTGRDLLDQLPLGFSMDGVDFLRWKRGTKDTENPGEVWIVDYQDYADLKNPDNWNIGEDGTTDQQRINWGANFSVTIKNKPLYIYVRVTFPSGPQWEEYGAQYANTTLENTLYIKGVADTVRHTLSIPAKAYLQKGVYLSHGHEVYDIYERWEPNEADTLFYYANTARHKWYVCYYAALYNGGSTRLYINNLQDVLPQGFTYESMIVSADQSHFFGAANINTTYSLVKDMSRSSDASLVMDSGAKPTWVEACVTADSSKAGFITFSIGKGSDDRKIPQIHFDEKRGRYYLEPNEGIKFLYRCTTNERKDTLDVATNSILMPYYDFNHSGLEVSDTHFTRTPGKNYNSDNYTPNDGSCAVIDNTQATAMGCSGDYNGTQWLISSVDQVRDEIKPGITKKLIKAISDMGVETDDPFTAYPTDTLRWQITAANDSYEPIIDYTLTDIMQDPYCFAGEYSYGFPYTGDINLGAVKFTLSAPDKDGNIRVYDHVGSETLKINGGPVELYSHCKLWDRANKKYFYKTFFLEITRDDTPNAPYRLSLHFKDPVFAIPPWGSGTLTVDTKRVDKTLENKVFVNTCYITPMSQTWDNTTNKGNMTTLHDVFGEDNKPTVRNSAQVTTSYGYVTSSLKSVEEKDNPENSTTCNTNPNYIVLPNKESLFTYTLTVDAPDENAMDQLILIDGLPGVGDHSCFHVDDPRASEFDVAFADDPQVSVTVTREDKSVTTLTPDQYIVEFSSKTEFDKNDWNGSSAWDKDHTDASRSMRIKILDVPGELIPAKSHVSVRFDGKIKGDAKPGQIAWNSFGYHYSVVDDVMELEAAPLKVGIMIPGIPELVKQVVDESGTHVAGKEDKTFRFLLYTGASLKETDEAKLAELLTSKDRNAVYLELKVEAGKSASNVMQLANLKLCTYQNGAWMQTDKPWTWTSGASYTLVELPCDDPLYHFDSINRRTEADGYTFYYQNDQTLVLSAVNVLDVWSFTICKTDAGDNSALTGAWFALYSPSPDDMLTDEAYDALREKPTQKPALTIEQDGKMWYLSNVSQTRDIENKHGTLTWSGLLRDSYCYREIQAPMGYQLDETIRTAMKSDLIHTVTIPNAGNAVALPETGGIGTSWFTMGGLLLLAAACLIEYVILRKRERGIDG